MYFPKNRGSLLRTCALCALSALLLVFSGVGSARKPARQPPAQDGSQMPVTVAQLTPVNGEPPVALRCENAELSAADTIEEIRCFIKNNSNKRVSAITLAYSVTTGKDGKEAADISHLTVDTSVHPDLRADGADKRIPPHGELPIRELSTTYHDAVVKAIKVWIDYVEFDDDTTSGQNRAGSRIVNDMRLGAGRYKDWLARQHKLSGRSSGALARLLEKNPSPAELGIQSGLQEQGVTFYKDYARKLTKERGVGALAERLESTPASRNE